MIIALLLMFQKSLSYAHPEWLSVPKVNGGREGRPIGAYELAKVVEELGAGEILLNCIDCDGINKFFVTQTIPPYK